MAETETTQEEAPKEEAPKEETPKEEPITSKASQLDDFMDASMSFFNNEKRASLAWLIWTGIYWSFVMWIPTLINQSFNTPGLFVYCVAAVGMFATGYSITAGLYPSGAIEGKPNDYSGRGRWAAVFLAMCISADLLGIMFITLHRKTPLDQYFRAGCHFLSLVWCSLFYFNRFRKANPQVAWPIFWAEWGDVLFTVIVMFFLRHSYIQEKDKDNDKSCFTQAVCTTYYSFFIIQVVGWIGPMMVIQGWGARKHAKIVGAHLALLDLISDFPIAIAIVAEDAYAWHPLIFIDAMYKTVGFIRSFSYYMVYYVWLKGGLLGILRPDKALHHF